MNYPRTALGIDSGVSWGSTHYNLSFPGKHWETKDGALHKITEIVGCKMSDLIVEENSTRKLKIKLKRASRHRELVGALKIYTEQSGTEKMYLLRHAQVLVNSWGEFDNLHEIPAWLNRTFGLGTYDFKLCQVHNRQRGGVEMLMNNQVQLAFKSVLYTDPAWTGPHVSNDPGGDCKKAEALVSLMCVRYGHKWHVYSKSGGFRSEPCPLLCVMVHLNGYVNIYDMSNIRSVTQMTGFLPYCVMNKYFLESGVGPWGDDVKLGLDMRDHTKLCYTDRERGVEQIGF